MTVHQPYEAAPEQYARDKGLSRSDLYAQALAYFLHAHRNAPVTEELDHIYAQEPSSLDANLGRAQVQAVMKEEW